MFSVPAAAQSLRITPPPIICYDEDAVAGDHARGAEDAYGIPVSWHTQLDVFLQSDQKTPAGLSPEVLSLPELRGSKNLPNLRAAVQRDREKGRQELFEKLKELQSRSIDAFYTDNGSTRDEMKEVLYLWAAVDDIDAESRGPFIDARQVAFLERVMGERFLQLGRYPNPAPMAAGSLKKGFNTALNHFYADFAMQAAGRQLFTQGDVLDKDVLHRLSQRAAKLSLPKEKTVFWRNVALSIPEEKLTAQNREILQAAMAESAPALTLEKALGKVPTGFAVAHDETSRAVDMQDEYTFYDGRSMQFDITFRRDLSSRHICYRYLD